MGGSGPSAEPWSPPVWVRGSAALRDHVDATRHRRGPVAASRWRGDLVGRAPLDRPAERRGCSGRDGGAERDGVLRVCVDRDRPAEFGGDAPCDRGDARGSPDQQHDVDLVRCLLCRPQRPPHGRHRLLECWPDHGLELVADQPHLGVERRQQHRDRHLGVGGERFLRRDAVIPSVRSEMRPPDR